MCSMMSFNVDHSETFPTEEETTKIPLLLSIFPPTMNRTCSSSTSSKETVVSLLYHSESNKCPTLVPFVEASPCTSLPWPTLVFPSPRQSLSITSFPLLMMAPFAINAYVRLNRNNLLHMWPCLRPYRFDTSVCDQNIRLPM